MINKQNNESNDNNNNKIELLKKQLQELEKKLTNKEIEIEEIKNDPNTLEKIEDHIAEKKLLKNKFKILNIK